MSQSAQLYRARPCGVMLEARCSWLVYELDAERKISRKLAEERDALQEENEKSKKLLLEFFRSKSDV